MSRQMLITQPNTEVVSAPLDDDESAFEQLFESVAARKKQLPPSPILPELDDMACARLMLF